MGKVLRMKHKGHTTKIHILLLLSLSIVLIFILFKTPLLNVKKIEIAGNRHYTDEYILNLLGVNDEKNFLLFWLNDSKKKLEQDPYIENAKIRYHFPNNVNIEIEEREVIGYVPYMGAYLYIDKNGRVVETKDQYTEQLPLVTGLQFEHFKLGEILKVKNDQMFHSILKISHTMIKYNLLNDVVKIDVNDEEDIHLYIRNIDVALGSIEDYDKKIRILLEVLHNIPYEDKGTLDIKDIDKPYIFRYLT